MGIIGAYGTAFIGHILPPDDLTLGLQHSFNQWFVWMSIIKSLFFAFIISSVSSYFGYTVEGGSVEVGKASGCVPYSITLLKTLAMIEVQNLTKAFGDKTVLDNISVKFETGKTNLIIGQSGSGKTVLMKNLVGLLEPTSGKVLYDGRDFVQMSKKEKVMMRREMGMIFQSAALFDSLNVLENVMFPLDMFSNMNYRERVKRAQECLDRVNLIDAQQKYPGEISGGMQKRVAIARAIVMNPKYLFCDEPNSGLDPKTSLVIDELLSGITKDYNMTTIINTHDMNSVMGIGENICFICKGHKEWQGNKDQVMSSTNEQLNDLVFASDLFRKVKEVEMKGKK